MGLSWRDIVTTIFMGVIAVIYVAFLDGTHAWLISSARGTTTAVLVLGMAGGCALSAAGDLYAGSQPRRGGVYQWAATMIGIVAFTAAPIGLITGSTVALAVLVAATFTLWFIATTRHAIMAPAGVARGRDTHEVIHQGDVPRR
jgi:hypothetical protein